MRVNRPKIKKRTPAQVREFVQKKIDADNLRLAAPPGIVVPATASSGAMATAVDLIRAKDALELIPNKADRTRIAATFATLTKYQALQVLLEGEIGKKFPEVAEQIADAMTEADYAALFTPPA